jgi:hypothetical protein
MLDRKGLYDDIRGGNCRLASFLGASFPGASFIGPSLLVDEPTGEYEENGQQSAHRLSLDLFCGVYSSAPLDQI